jgi:hypothetical protein
MYTKNLRVPAVDSNNLLIQSYYIIFDLDPFQVFTACSNKGIYTDTVDIIIIIVVA